MTDRPPAKERPGIEPQGRDGVRLPRSEVVFGLLLGLAMSAVLIAVNPDIRRHLFGGTELRPTTVVAAESRPRAGDPDREVAHYRLAWEDDRGAARTSTLERSGPVRHEVGDVWNLWVSPDDPTATDESPVTTWTVFAVAIPLIGLTVGWLIAWRRRLSVRAALAGPHRRRRPEEAA